VARRDGRQGATHFENRRGKLLNLSTALFIRLRLTFWIKVWWFSCSRRWHVSAMGPSQLTHTGKLAQHSRALGGLAPIFGSLPPQVSFALMLPNVSARPGFACFLVRCARWHGWWFQWSIRLLHRTGLSGRVKMTAASFGLPLIGGDSLLGV